MVPGFHLEGPFLNPTPGYAGCHPAEAMVSPDPALLQRVTQGLRHPVLLLTLAPERDGAASVIAWARQSGILVAMGHSAAGVAEVERAAHTGVRLSTHLGNALPQPQPKFLNPLMAQLAEDRMAASFIADGIHVPPHALKVMLRAKGNGRCILVTDATAAAAAPPGSIVSPAWRSSIAQTDRFASPEQPRWRDRHCGSIRRCAMSWPGGWPMRPRRSPWRPRHRRLCWGSIGITGRCSGPRICGQSARNPVADGFLRGANDWLTSARHSDSAKNACASGSVGRTDHSLAYPTREARPFPC